MEIQYYIGNQPRLSNTCILPIFPSGTEAWSVTVILSKKIDALDSWCLRRILNVHWSEFVTSDEIRSRTGQPFMSDTVCSRRLSFRHLHCADPSPDHYCVLQACNTGPPEYWWLETEDWPSQTILAENSGGWPATNEPRTGDIEAECSGQIEMAETHDNGYVYDKPLKKRQLRSSTFLLLLLLSLLLLFFIVIIKHKQKLKAQIKRTKMSQMCCTDTATKEIMFTKFTYMSHWKSNVFGSILKLNNHMDIWYVCHMWQKGPGSWDSIAKIMSANYKIMCS